MATTPPENPNARRPQECAPPGQWRNIRATRLNPDGTPHTTIHLPDTPPTDTP